MSLLFCSARCHNGADFQTDLQSSDKAVIGGCSQAKDCGTGACGYWNTHSQCLAMTQIIY